MRQAHLVKEVPSNSVGIRGVSLPLADQKAFRARSKVNGCEVYFGASRDVEKAKRMREDGIKILQSLSPEEISDLVGERKFIPIGRWVQWSADRMDSVSQIDKPEAADAQH
jgi:hypothetical protein